MTLFMISIPFMLVAVGIAVIPLLAISRKELRHIGSGFERYREQHSRAHHARRQHAHDVHHDDRSRARTPAREAESRRWHGAGADTREPIRPSSS
jgi:hypothetical protein